MAAITFNTTEADEINLLKIKEIAIKNGLGKTKPELFKLALYIAYNSIINADEDSFKELTSLTK